MKINLYRYLVKEQMVPLSVSFLGLTLILITGRLLQLTRYLFTSSATLLDLLEIVAFAMPRLIIYALPMAALIGVLLAFVRLNSDNELIAFRTAGIGFSQFFPAVLSVLLLVSILSYCNTLFFLPAANRAFEDKLKSMGRAGLPMLLKEGAFIDVIPKLVFFFQSVNTSDLSIEGVFVQDTRQPNVRAAIVAERAKVIYQRDLNHLTFQIHNGIITRTSESFKDAQAISFKAYDLTLSLDELLGGSDSKGTRDRRKMTVAELRDAMRLEGPKSDLRYALEIHQRFALPLACLLLGLAGAPLGALFRHRSRMTGITLGLAIFLAYYVALSGGKGLGENGLLPPFIAIWTPNILVLALALYLWIKIQRETPFSLAPVWEKTVRYVHNHIRPACRVVSQEKHR